MNLSERIIKLKHLITCMKCEISGKVCDENCPTQYAAGNLREIIENLEAISEIIEQQPCEDAISRQAVLDGLASIAKVKARSDAQKSLMGRIMFFVEQLPPVTPKEKTGHWIKYSIPRCGEQHYQCTSCGYYINFGQWGEVYTKQFKYCPSCSAKMVEPQESEIQMETVEECDCDTCKHQILVRESEMKEFNLYEYTCKGECIYEPREVANDD